MTLSSAVRRSAVSCLFLAFTVTAFCQDVAHKPALSSSADEVLAYAKDAKAATGTPAIILLDENVIEVDAQHRVSYTTRMIYKILTDKAAERGWDSVSAQYSPWHEAKPVIKARVVSASGQVHELDEKTITDAPVADDSRDIYSDRRFVRAPLPAIAPGSVVEQVTVYKETAPLYKAGLLRRFYMGANVPVSKTTYAVSWPAALPLKWQLDRIPGVQPAKTVQGETAKLTFELGPLKRWHNKEAYQVPEAADWGMFTISTVPSWSAAADSYREEFEQRVASADLKPLIQKAIAGKQDRAEIIQALMSLLHNEVRYTGVEFGQAAIIPSAPADTWKRKFGDCKDKSALLVAMLRSAGIAAHPALLLSDAYTEDVAEAMPGMNLFDHEIVYVPGIPEYFIDATDQYSRLGDLPSSDQGRQALVIAPGVTGLKRIPEAPSVANLLIEEREFELPEYGKAKIRERSIAHGQTEARYRYYYGQPISKESREGLEKYVKEIYLADNLARFDHGDGKDFSKPFEMTLTVEKGKRGSADIDEAAVGIPQRGLFDRLPAYVWNEEGNEEDEEQIAEEGDDDDQSPPEPTDKPKDKPKKVRKTAMLLPEAFVTEWRYRIKVPAIFQARELPKNRKRNLGPAVLEETYKKDGEGQYSAVLRLDTVKKRYTAAEVTEFKKALTEWGKEQVTILQFEHTGRALMSAGKTREALDFYRSSIRQHPKEALHHMQLAQAFLEAGVGDAAREEARLATQLEPKSIEAHKILGSVLEHDLVGRRFAPGFDPAGAEAALKKVIELEPDEPRNKASLGELYEYDATGQRYSSQARLKDALAQFQSIKDKLDEIGYTSFLYFDLLHTDQFAALRDEISGLTLDSTGLALLAAAVAGAEGPEAALAELNRRTSGETYTAALGNASLYLLQRRRYPEAQVLAQAALRTGKLSGNDAQAVARRASLLQIIKRRESAAVPPSDPTFPLYAVLDDMLSSQPITIELVNRYASRNGKPHSPVQEHQEFVKSRATGLGLRHTLRNSGLPPEVMADLMMGILRLHVEGDDTVGYRIRTEGPGSGSGKNTLFVVKEGGKYLALGDSEEGDGVGFEVLDRLERNDLKSAKQLLDWVREDQKLAGGEDPISGLRFPRFWNKGDDPSGDRARYAAAALIAQGLAPERAIPILQEGLQKAATAEAKLPFELALVSAYRNSQRYEEMYPLAAELLQRYPDSDTALNLMITAGAATKRWTEVEAAIRTRMKKDPNDIEPLRALSRMYTLAERYADAHTAAAEILRNSRADVNDYNGYAWHALFTGVISKEDFDAAERGVTMSNSNNAPMLHTQLCLQAEEGNLRELRQSLLHLMDLWELDEPNDQTWYIFGRIAERLGADSAAINAYKRLEKPQEAIGIPSSTYALAAKRLESLQKSMVTVGK